MLISHTMKEPLSVLVSHVMILLDKRITKALISLCGCAGWSAPVLFANSRRQVFSRRGPYRILYYQTNLPQYPHMYRLLPQKQILQSSCSKKYRFFEYVIQIDIYIYWKWKLCPTMRHRETCRKCPNIIEKDGCLSETHILTSMK